MALAFFAGVAVMELLLMDTTSPWYLELKRSKLLLPDMAYCIVWLVAWGALAASFALIFLKTEGRKGLLYLLLGALDGLGCFLFFGSQDLAACLILAVIAIMIGLLLFCKSAEEKPFAAYLTIPYILWLGYQLVIRYDMLLLN